MQVWDQTDELKDFRANRFKLTLTESLAVVFQKLAKQALDAGILSQTWLHHSSQKNTELKSDAAHYRIQMLQFQSQIKSLSHTPHVSNILLVKSEDGLVHDPKVLPVLPPCFDDLWTDGPLSDKARPHWSKFHLLSFETAQSLLRQAGSCGGVYQMWLSRRERQTNGSYKTVMRTELYVGSATGQLFKTSYRLTRQTMQLTLKPIASVFSRYQSKHWLGFSCVVHCIGHAVLYNMCVLTPSVPWHVF